jgi:hypothetical protein
VVIQLGLSVYLIFFSFYSPLATVFLLATCSRCGRARGGRARPWPRRPVLLWLPALLE